MSLLILLTFWSKLIIVAYFVIFIWLRTVSSSVEQQIFATAGYRALDIFHVSPESTVKAMLDLDMMMSFSQLKNMTAEETSSSRRKRVIKKSHHGRWRNGIVPYELAQNIKHMQDNIKIAIGYFTTYSCLRFQENTYSLPRVQFSVGNSCWSDIGVTNKTITRIVLSKDCQSVSTIIHEIGHAIGLFHEHNRPDRDRYITIAGQYKTNAMFNKVNLIDAVTGGIPYDYRSIMHYSNGITPRDSRFVNTIGKVWNLSFRDLKLINLVYQCALRASCEITGRNCQFNGFVLSKSLKNEPACKCWCDSGDKFTNDPLVLCSSLTNSREPVYDLGYSSLIESADTETCFDVLSDCTALKARGLCVSEFTKMKTACTKTCNLCGKDQEFCLDYEDACVLLGDSGTCAEEGLQDFMNEICPKSCGQCTRLVSDCDIERNMEGKNIFHIGNCSSTNRRWITAIIVLLFLLC